MTCRGTVVFASGKLIPFVVGQSVAVGVIAHHHDSRFGRASLAVWVGELVEAVAPDAEVCLSGHVDHRVVEPERHIAAISAERYHDVVGTRYRLFGLLQDVGVAVALLISGHLVDELPRGRTIFVDARDVWTVFHFLVHHGDRELVGIWRVGIDDVEPDMVFPLFGLHEYVVALLRHDVGRAAGACQRPAVFATRQGRVERQFAHPLNIIGVVDAEAHCRNVGGAAGHRQYRGCGQ